MEGFLREVRDFILSWRLSVVAFVATTLFLFLPEAIARQLGIDQVRSQYDPFPGLIWLVVTAAVCLHLIQLVRPWISRRRNRRRIVERLDGLSDGGRDVVAYCVLAQRRSVLLPTFHGVTQELVGQGVLRAVGNTSAGWRWTYSIPDDVWSVIARRWFERQEVDVEEFQRSDSFHWINEHQADPTLLTEMMPLEERGRFEQTELRARLMAARSRA